MSVQKDKEKIWELGHDVKVQGFLLEDMDNDGTKELLVLCWKRGRFGKKKPTWIKMDELAYSQHIFVYEIDENKVIPKWMASDIGPEAVSWSFDKGVLSITDTLGKVTGWKWKTWGFEKM